MVKKSRKTDKDTAKEPQEMLQDELQEQEQASPAEAPQERSREQEQEKDPVEDLRLQLAALNDKYLRLYSEFENYRKRVSKEKLDLLKNASEEVITSLLPVLDDFDRAIRTLEEKGDDDPVLEGIHLIRSKFLGILMQKGLEPTDAMGKEFDTDYHEAITSIPAPSGDMKGKVIDVTEKGYLLNGKVIRYAKVVVGA